MTSLPNGSGSTAPGWKAADFELRRDQASRLTLDDEQLDGLACVYCGGSGGAMASIGDGPRGQLFLHVDPCFRP